MDTTQLRKGTEKYKNHNKSAHVVNCSEVRGELVLVQFCELLIYRSSSTIFELGCFGERSAMVVHWKAEPEVKDITQELWKESPPASMLLSVITLQSVKNLSVMSMSPEHFAFSAIVTCVLVLSVCTLIW